MTDLSRLKVSLTKHNAHKIANLLKTYKANQILVRLHEMHVEEAQTRKNLSILSDDDVPKVWSKAKKLGDDAIDALVLIGIVFSHQKLIEAMINASPRSRFKGCIERGGSLNGKAYTNFARIIDQLGFASKLTYPSVTFNIGPIFEIPGLGPLVGELLSYKLNTAGWDHSNSIVDEAVAQRFHRVFGVTAKEFKEWLSADIRPIKISLLMLPKDEDFFQAADEIGEQKEFQFRAGHIERAVEPIARTASFKTKTNQLHNDIQNRLYAYLCSELGTTCVGTEQDTGAGTAIDVVAKQNNRTIFFEIKTSASVRTNIRQAIPQLLEYAYWPNEKRADELVIVSHLPITRAAHRYLTYLQEHFKLPLSYRQFDLKKNKLI